MAIINENNVIRGEKMDNPLISIVIPVYNAVGYIRQLLNSILQQSYLHFEVICVDDGSTDASLHILHEFSEKDSRVRVIHQDNAGVSSARNTGVDFARGMYIVFVDADDFLNENALEVMLSYHDGQKNTIVAVNYDRAAAAQDEIHREPDIVNPDNCVLHKHRVLQIVSMRRGCYIWGMLIPKVLIDEHHIKFPENIGNLEDVVWLGIALGHVENVVYIKSPLYHYRENPTSITSNCTDYRWQAEHWIKVLEILTNYFLQNSAGELSKRYIHKYFRLCKNNFYAECFAGALSYTTVKSMAAPLNNKRTHLSLIEYGFYKHMFCVRKGLRKIIKK
ncbi:MAG TPA: glycosyltransferase family 2 protein [Candidatus Scubalenecus merdavium]|uniref:Glycosyltransferase family 2 protein n=1 Tax=Candidatus Scybalenecus merdavium TaxID=2840939 RepID=A0A9D1SN67_9FIRM|nr:glycosyltransferase family 2 protein [Candidatus Scubalenecus merdavium]